MSEKELELVQVDDQSTPSQASTSSEKTPMFAASNAARYHRQEIIRQIEATTGNKLICYVAGVHAPIDRDDTIGFMELLHNINKGSDLDLLLHTPGGDIDAAEKLTALLHSWTGADRKLRVIVPDYAKSAGTLISLGANKIVMSDSSELGPIDPQFALKDGRGNQFQHSVLHYLQAYETHSATLTNPATSRDVTASIMLSKLDPTTIKLFEAIKERARKIAEDQMRHWMKSPAWSKVPNELIDVNKFPSHGQRIGYADAQVLQLEVDYLSPSDSKWRLIWNLYCHLRLAIGDKGKIFESSIASHCLESG